MVKYKLTTQQLRTHNDFQWTVGTPVTTNGKGMLCGPGWLHYYDDPLLAILLNPFHADINNPRMFKVKAEGKHLNDLGLKGGCTRMTLVEEIPVPNLTTEQRIRFAILCALEVYKEPSFVRWAQLWLSGENRSMMAAREAALASKKRPLNLIELAQKAIPT